MPVQSSGYEYFDDFMRTTLNPTNAIAMYTLTTDTTGTAAIGSTRDRVTLTTAALTGNDVGIVTSGLTFNRRPADYNATYSAIDVRSRLEMDMIFNIGTNTSTESFIGMNSTSATALAGLPTTQTHFGIQVDHSASANWFFTSSDGTTQVTADSAVATTTGLWRLNLLWNGLNSVTMTLFDTTNASVATNSVTALGSSTSYILQYFVQTETTAARTLVGRGWHCKWS